MEGSIDWNDHIWPSLAARIPSFELHAVLFFHRGCLFRRCYYTCHYDALDPQDAENGNVCPLTEDNIYRCTVDSIH